MASIATNGNCTSPNIYKIPFSEAYISIISSDVIKISFTVWPGTFPKVAISGSLVITLRISVAP